MTAPTVQAIQAAVCLHYRLPVIAMTAPARRRCWARPRQVAMYLACELTIQSLPQIGREFGRDHTTIMHGRRVIPGLMASSPSLTAAVAQLWRDLTGAPMPPRPDRPGPAA